MGHLHRREMAVLRDEKERLEREAFQREELIKALQHRATKAEDELQIRISGGACQESVARANGLQRQLTNMETNLHDQIRMFSEATKRSNQDRKDMEEKVAAAESEAAIAAAEQSLAKRRGMRMRRRLRRCRRAVKADPPCDPALMLDVSAPVQFEGVGVGAWWVPTVGLGAVRSF